jgi:hypothetical protein
VIAEARQVQAGLAVAVIGSDQIGLAQVADDLADAGFGLGLTEASSPPEQAPRRGLEIAEIVDLVHQGQVHKAVRIGRQVEEVFGRVEFTRDESVVHRVTLANQNCMIELITTLERELRARTVPDNVDALSERLQPLTLGLRQEAPVLLADTRLFRIRRMNRKPDSMREVGAPPPEKSSIGRLNDDGQSILYCADTPETAFAEARGPVAGEFCLSEWRVTAQRLGMVNGGISPTMLAARCPIKIGGDPSFPTTKLPEEEELILAFHREIYTLDVGAVPALYRWSIACGLANGFSHRCGRTSVETTADGNTKFNGRYPFAGIAYPSMRTGQAFWNFAFNDCGQSQIRLEHVQWIRRSGDGSWTSRDYANAWDSDGRILWKNRPANFELKPGEQFKLIKVAPDVWRYETEDGSVPWFS